MHSALLIARIESTARPNLAAPWDKSGIQIASTCSDIRTLCVALEPTVETVRQAVDMGAHFLLCHHPLTLAPRLPDRVDALHQILHLSLGKNLWLYSAHTSLDANPTGPVNWLGRALGLRDMRVLEVSQRETPRLVCLEQANAVVQNFMPLPQEAKGTPYLLWPEELPAFRAALGNRSVVYEMPLDAPTREYGFGCIGTLPAPLSWPEFADHVAAHINVAWRTVGSVPQAVSCVAYCPGSGADLAGRAFDLGADIYLTGDLKYHQALDVRTRGLTLDVGHFCLEEHMMREWSEDLAASLAPEGVRVIFLPGQDPFD